MATSQAAVYRERPFLAVALTHFFVDVLNNGRNLLVALLAVSLGLTNAQVGLALLIYNVGNALSQPLFGWLADRIGARRLVVGSLGWVDNLLHHRRPGRGLAGADCPDGGQRWLPRIPPSGTMVASRTSITCRSRNARRSFSPPTVRYLYGAGAGRDAAGCIQPSRLHPPAHFGPHRPG